MIKYILIFSTFFCLNIWAQEVPLNNNDIQTFKQRIEKETKSLTSIRTDFIQEKHMSFLSNDIASNGKMYLNAKGFLKWEYTSPNKYSVIFKNNMIYINDNGDRSAVRTNQEIFKKISHLIAGSISGQLFDDKEFMINYYKEGTDVIVKLIPKDKALMKYIKQVNLYFPNDSNTVSKVKMIEPSGDYTFISFINKALNVQIDPHIFNN